ncbi:HupE/UreJ family protein [Sinirhodobacter sp. WL0062]|uniref:HupE/UreJ family protein n=1 Tax=Rhodobacter flavimaris TaxID=2907145 RepID=A0ABS8YV32_9RHOB|nr:HupE/UreJ family protein [Sinirhodobacter sp. WL0062]MCE5972364.1 HupE/UreJ family protein [Sinirhodobacter sp. WL0062]
MKKFALATLLALLAAPAMAHPGHGVSGFEAGVTHPLLGADHLLAMLTVGLWSGFALPRRAWAGPAAFLGAMIVGAALGFAGLVLPGAELAITGSVVVFGLMVAFARPGRSASLPAGTLAAIAAFALFHGYAHAAEATGAASLFVAGFIASTAMLHLVGVVLARAIASGRGAAMLRRGLGLAVVTGGLALIGG